MDYQSNETYELKSIPDVKLVLRKMSHGRRMQLNQMAASVFQDLAELQQQLEPIEADIKRVEQEISLLPADFDGPKPEPDPELGGYRKQAELTAKIFELLIYRLYPIYIRWGVAELQGLKINGAPATIDSFLAEMPEPVVNEVGTEIQRLIRLTPEEVLGFKSATTSGAVVDGQPTTSDPTAPSTAPSANATANI